MHRNGFGHESGNDEFMDSDADDATETTSNGGSSGGEPHEDAGELDNASDAPSDTGGGDDDDDGGGSVASGESIKRADGDHGPGAAGSTDDDRLVSAAWKYPPPPSVGSGQRLATVYRGHCDYLLLLGSVPLAALASHLPARPHA